VSAKSILYYSIIALSLGTALVMGLTACGNEGPIAPDNLHNPLAPATPYDLDDGSVRPVPLTPDPDPTPNDTSNDKIVPAGDLSSESIYDLAAAMFYLQECGGGVLSVPMDPDQFAIHVWDAVTEANLDADVVVSCSGGPSSLVSVHGYQVFENASFPINVTVLSHGYAMVSVVGTNANVLSFAMLRPHAYQSATVFGTVQNLGYDTLQVYSDTLLPTVSMEHPSEANPDYTKFELSIEADKVNGFSAFLVGMLDSGLISSKGAVSPEEFFWTSSYFEWEIPPLKAGTRRFYPVVFMTKQGPAGVAEGLASIPGEYWTEDQINNGLSAAIPTAIFLEDRRYLPIGPYVPFDGEDPSGIEYQVPYFDPAIGPDRIVMAGHMVLTTGEADIVHRDWHPGYNPGDLVFSGVPTVELHGGPGVGWTYPIFAWVDPTGGESTLTRIEMYGGAGGWFIVLAGDGANVDSASLDIPLSWFPEIFGTNPLRYRVECINADGQDIDDFNEDQVIMNRRETCFSRWMSMLP
jgi:hypothetical protein